MSYEELLEHRRHEKLHNVDRYVPGGAVMQGASPPRRSTRFKPSGVFKLALLPVDVLEKIFTHLLVKPNGEPIRIDFYWLRPFLKGHARVPAAHRTIEGFTVPASWSDLLAGVDNMKNDMLQFNKALTTRGFKTKTTRSPCWGLQTGLLRILNKKIHAGATKTLYGGNTFKFACMTSGWMQLESFLVTIGPKNAGEIKHLQIHAPLWHRGVQEDFIEGAIVDSFSPASRFGVIKPPAHDRLLSAVTYVTNTLIKSDIFESLTLDLENTPVADQWSGRLINDKRLVSVFDVEEFVERKRKGFVLLKQLSEALVTKGKSRPVVQLCNPVPHVKEQLGRRRGKVNWEAEKHGWVVGKGVKDTR